MSVRPIVLLGDPRLRLKGEQVDSFGRFLHGLLDDLTHTMRAAPGVGLAAPQIGEALEVCVVEVEDQLHELVNPKIVRVDRRRPRPRGLPVHPGLRRLRDPARERLGRRPGSARPKIKVAGSGLLGRAFQHELDHLDGKLYIDYLDSMDELISVGPMTTRRTRTPRTTRGRAAERDRTPALA